MPLHFFFTTFLPATAALKPAPAGKRGTVVAAIFSSLPVWGLRPVRAARLEDLKEPNPIRLNKRQQAARHRSFNEPMRPTAKAEDATVDYPATIGRTSAISAGGADQTQWPVSHWLLPLTPYSARTAALVTGEGRHPTRGGHSQQIKSMSAYRCHSGR